MSAYLAECALQLPSGPHQQLRQQSQLEWRNGLRHKALLALVLDVLADANVSPTPLKGYGLAARIYPQPLSRPASDVDVLVEPHLLAAATTALQAAGAVLQPSAKADVAGHELTFHHPLGLIELHFGLHRGFGGRGLNPTDLTRVEGLLEGRSVHFLKPEVEFVMLAAHAAQSVYLRVSWLLDLALFLRTYPTLDWSEIMTLSQKSDHALSTAAALMLLEQLFEVKGVPPSALQPLSGWRQSVLRQVFSAQRLADASLSERRELAFAMRLLFVEHPGQWLRYAHDASQRLLGRLSVRLR